MKTFAEMLPTATAETREFVEAYDVALVEAQKNMKAGRSYTDPRDVMRSTPPAKGPVSVLKEIAGIAHAGGLEGLGAGDALIRIRKLSLPYWDEAPR